MNEPLVSIILLSWNDYKYTIDCIDSLRKMSYKNIKVIVVDQDSRKDIYEKIKEHCEDEILIRLKENVGFADGNNVGVKKAKALNSKYVLILNNDTVVEPDFLEGLVTYMEMDSTIGVIGPRINYMDNKELIWCVGGKFNIFTGNNKLLGNKTEYAPIVADNEIDVGYVSGCALMTRMAILDKMELFDSNYFIYNEESDFCYRVKKELGLRRVVVLNSVIYHKVSLTNDKISGFSAYYLTRNRPYFVKKHNSKLTYIIYLFYFSIIEIPMYTAFYLLYTKSFTNAKFFLIGVNDYFSGRMGKNRKYFQ